jgi:hypothetical protein
MGARAKSVILPGLESHLGCDVNLGQLVARSHKNVPILYGMPHDAADKKNCRRGKPAIAQAVGKGIKDFRENYSKDRELNHLHRLDPFQERQPCAPTTNPYFI